MLKKILRTLLISFLVTNQATAQQTNDLRSLTVDECTRAQVHCTCFNDASLAKIAGQIRLSTTCQYDLAQYKDYSKAMDDNAWYTDTTFVVAGTVVGVSLAGVLGYLIGARKN